MSRIQEAFAKNKKLFIGFVTAGDPNLATTKELVLAMVKAGVGIVEFGIPFSDPVAEGPVIQRADLRALEAGTTTDKIFDLVAELRQETQVPLVFLTYANPIYAYGAEKFFTRCEESGVDGVIIPDIPYEEREEMRPYSEPHKVALVPLIAPTSRDRIQKIAQIGQGYIYIVSSLGVPACARRSPPISMLLWTKSARLPMYPVLWALASPLPTRPMLWLKLAMAPSWAVRL